MKHGNGNARDFLQISLRTMDSLLADARQNDFCEECATMAALTYMLAALLMRKKLAAAGEVNVVAINALIDRVVDGALATVAILEHKQAPIAFVQH